jgi:hypothetical protein
MIEAMQCKFMSMDRTQRYSEVHKYDFLGFEMHRHAVPEKALLGML